MAMLCAMPRAVLAPHTQSPLHLRARPALAGPWMARTVRHWRRPDTPLRAVAADPHATLTALMSARDEKTLFGILRETGSEVHVSPRLLSNFGILYASYKAAVLSSGRPGGDEASVVRMMGEVCALVMQQLHRPHRFAPHHRRVTQPYDYYDFGQRYMRALIDFRSSVVGHMARWQAVDEALAAGHNVVLLANHQSEADPAVVSLLLESAFPRIATDIAYVAGDRVVSDPICIPFSLGRNLFCVHSKKHMDDDPKLKSAKSGANRKALKAMQKALKSGGQLLWVAPSGGRDRRCDGPGRFVPDPFDATVVELMRTLLAKPKHPGHLIPMAMFSYPIIPPPATVEKEVGEQRVVKHTGVGISLCEDLDISGTRHRGGQHTQGTLAEAAFAAVREEFLRLRDAVEDPSRRGNEYAQPWVDAGRAQEAVVE